MSKKIALEKEETKKEREEMVIKLRQKDKQIIVV